MILRLKCTKIVFGWGSAPDPAGGANSAPPDPVAGLIRGPPPKGGVRKEGEGVKWEWEGKGGQGRGREGRREEGSRGEGKGKVVPQCYRRVDATARMVRLAERKGANLVSSRLSYNSTVIGFISVPTLPKL